MVKVTVRKRGSGEGSIRWDEVRKNFRVRLRCQDERGKRVQKTIGWYDSHEEGRLARDEAVRRRDNGVAVGAKAQTVGAFLTNYLEMRWTTGAISRNTYEKWCSLNKLHLLPDLGKITVKDLKCDRHIDPLWGAEDEGRHLGRPLFGICGLFW